MKPLFFSLIGLGVAASLLSNSAVAEYSDTGSIPKNQQEAINELTDRELVEGYEDGTFRPTQSVNRAEFLKVLVAASGKSTPTSDEGVCFKDFVGATQWYWASACAAKKAGIISGYDDGTFKGGRFINIAEAMKIAANAFDVTLPVYIRAPDHWYEPYMTAMSGEGVFDGVRREPASFLTRAEMAFVVVKLSAIGQLQCDGHALGESYKVDCNTCTCTESGPACTKMACLPQKKCLSSNDCSSTQRCSTEWGDCKSACEPGAEMCPAVCAGVCEEK
ncbi:S-layer homology domain-containing protein [Candidatus Peregrinibacteria bacterium]|nr:S-layer homology domain-containing protein [Candidatus Peregrinibacteria bacterium]